MSTNPISKLTTGWGFSHDELSGRARRIKSWGYTCPLCGTQGTTTLWRRTYTRKQAKDLLHIHMQRTHNPSQVEASIT